MTVNWGADVLPLALALIKSVRPFGASFRKVSACETSRNCDACYPNDNQYFFQLIDIVELCK